MSNWTNITAAIVKTGKSSIVFGAVQSDAAARSEADPTPEMIADVVARIRAAVSVGNSLDVDPTKIPNSLKGLAVRMVTRRLKDYLEMPLSPDENQQAKEDASYLTRIGDDKIRFETPDNPAANAEMQSAGGGIEQATGGNIPGSSNNPPGVFTRDSLSGL